MGTRLLRLGAIALAMAWISAAFGQTDPLPSWNDGPAKQAIIAFVTDVTREGSPDFAPESERIATFDNDGTLWIEQPIYVQFAFAFDRVKALAPQHPEWKETQPFKAVLDGDMDQYPEQAFYMVGGREDVERKAAELTKGAAA